MKKTKKILALVVAYIFMIMLLPSGIMEKTAKAEESVKEMLQYSNLYVNSATQYKDNSLISYYYEDEAGKGYENYVSVFSNGKEENILSGKNDYIIDKGGFYGEVTSNPRVSTYNQNYEVEDYEYNFQTKEFKKVLNDSNLNSNLESDKDKILAKVNSELSDSYSSDNLSIGRFLSRNYKNKEYRLYEFSLKLENEWPKYYVAVVWDDTVLIVNNSSIYKVSIIGENKILVSDFNIISGDYGNYGNQNYGWIKTELDFEVYEKDKLIKSSKIIKDGYTYYASLCNENFIIHGNNNTNTVYSLNENNEMVLSDEIGGYITPYGLFYDINRDIWCYLREENATYLCKIENGKIVKKYEVDSDMQEMSVYDDNNFILWGKGESGYKVTNVCNGKFVDLKPGENNPSEEEPSQEEPSKPDTDDKDNSTIPEDTLDPNGVNNVTFENKYDVYEATTSDIEAIKNGTGSFEFVIKDSVNMNIPFNIIDKALLENAKEVKVTCEKIKDSEIIKDLKAVNKVFDLSISVEYNDGSVKSIHKFADGTVEVKLTLTDEELKGLDRSKLKVFYYNEETKKFEMVETKVEGNDITFITNHFSKFIIAEADGNKPVKEVSSKKDNNKKKTTSSEKTTKTGDNNLAGIYLGMATLALVGMCGVVYSKRKKTNN